MWSVIGQTRAVSLLQRALETGSLASAYLLIGPAHVGKMTLALNLAQALNCEGDQPPCGGCAPCQRIASGKHADVQTIGLGHKEDAAEARSRAEISIDQIRQVQHSVSLPPFEGRYRVFIINEAEFLSIEAANCLLKTLEEPVGKVVFILLTTSEQLLPATVISRCQRVELAPLAIGEIESALSNAWGVEPQLAKLLARLAQGCLGWAVCALDDTFLQQRASHLDGLLNVISADVEERFAYAARLAAQFGQDRGLVKENLDLWLGWWRDLLLVKAGLGDAITNVDRLDTLVNLAEGYSLVQIRAFIDNLQAATEQLWQNASPRLVLEVLMLDLPKTEKHGGGESTARFEVKHG